MWVTLSPTADIDPHVGGEHVLHLHWSVPAWFFPA